MEIAQFDFDRVIRFVQVRPAELGGGAIGLVGLAGLLSIVCVLNN